MARSLDDKVERLEDWVVGASTTLALMQEAQKDVVQREERLETLESLVSWLKGAAWTLGTLFLALTSLVGLYLSKGGS